MAGEGAFAAVGRVAVDGAAFDGAVEGGTQVAGLGGGGGFVFRAEGGVGLFAEGFEGLARAAVAGRADFGLTGAFGGGFDVGHKGGGFFVGARGENRTPDQGLMSPLLYR